MITSRLKRAVRTLLNRAGFDVIRVARPDDRYQGASADASRALPAGAAQDLATDHPRLAELRARYARSELPMALRTMWGADYLERELDLTRFRGDNVYVWQFRNVGASAHHKYYVYLRDLATRDPLGLLGKLKEDGLFGCWVFDYPDWPPVSRDLLDSINELYFLERHTQLLSRPGMTVLDIGAGYGRLAHRALAAAPQLSAWLCTDAVPESTFLCEYYLRFRGCLDRAQVLPLDELDAKLAGRKIDVAVNIHSFSEMSGKAIDGWLSRVAAHGVPWLLIVPNDGERLISSEEDGTRPSFEPLLAKHGYALAVKEPVFADPTLREFMNISDHFFLFRRR
jgi:hypothetical protein